MCVGFSGNIENRENMRIHVCVYRTLYFACTQQIHVYILEYIVNIINLSVTPLVRICEAKRAGAKKRVNSTLI